MNDNNYYIMISYIKDINMKKHRIIDNDDEKQLIFSL